MTDNINHARTSNGLVHALPRNHMGHVSLCGLFMRNARDSYFTNDDITCLVCVIAKFAETIRVAEMRRELDAARNLCSR